MGNSQSVRRSAAQTKIVKEQQSKIQTSNQQSLIAVQKLLDERLDAHRITADEYAGLKNTFASGEDLIDRGSKPLAKDDYVAIILTLTPEYLRQKYTIQNIYHSVYYLQH